MGDAGKAHTGSGRTAMDEDDEKTGPRLEETKRVARLISLASLLTARPRHWTRAGLAKHFERSER